jgi:hypothetical protein
MIRTSSTKRNYQSAHDRLLKPAIINFFSREFPGLFGPVIKENIASALISLFETLCPPASYLKPGQIIWNALDVKTRGSSQNRRYKTVILSVVTDKDIDMFKNGKSLCDIRKNVISRMIKEAYQQGGVLSTRDLSLLLVHDASYLSRLRIKFEQVHNTVLPHTGVIHDMGSTITHKRQIIYKHIVEKKDPVKVAYETNHSQRAVDRYIKDYHRVKTLTDEKKDVDYIHMVTNISKQVIRQYQQIIYKYVKEPV